MNVIVSNKNQNILATLDIDVIKNINGVFTVEELVNQFKNFFYNKMIIDITAIDNYQDINTIQKLSVAFDMNKVIILLDDTPKVNSGIFLSGLVSMGIYNFARNVDLVKYLINNPNTYKDVSNYHQLNLSRKDFTLNDKNNYKDESYISQRIIGVKNLTEHAGSTTMAYSIKKHLQRLYKVILVETNKSDLEYFSDSDNSSVDSVEIRDFLNEHKENEVIVIDINDDETENYCTDVLYLIEPGIIQLNRLVERDNRVFEKIKNQKIILNRSILSPNDVRDFERESGIKVFYNIGLIDDKVDDIKEINEFLQALGFSRFETDSKKGGFGLFR